MQAMHEEPVPETEEYGIGSFVYRARRPFHPHRLHSFMTTYFTLQQPEFALEDSDDDEEGNGLASHILHCKVICGISTYGGAWCRQGHSMLYVNVKLKFSGILALANGSKVSQNWLAVVPLLLEQRAAEKSFL